MIYVTNQNNVNKLLCARFLFQQSNHKTRIQNNTQTAISHHKYNTSNNAVEIHETQEPNCSTYVPLFMAC